MRAAPSAPSRRARVAARRFLPVVLALAVAAVGCGRDEAAPATGTPAASAPGAPADRTPTAPDIGTLEAVALEVGTTVDADGRVAVPTERVRPGDTVYASLVTVGAAEGAPIAVQWRDAAGTVLSEDAHTVAAEGPAVHTFRRAPETPWAPGAYEVEVTLGAQSAGVRAFEVR